MASGNRPIQFMLGPSPRIYFNELEKTTDTGKFKILLQKYWLCALIGCLFDKPAQRENDDVWVNDYFPEPLKGNQHLIRALGFFRYADKLGYSAEDEDDLLTGMKDFFEDDTRTKLSGVGLDTFDHYAAGGFKLLNEKIPEPSDLAEFLIDYVNLIEEKDGED